jgi:hypothetical protein
MALMDMIFRRRIFIGMTINRIMALNKNDTEKKNSTKDSREKLVKV